MGSRRARWPIQYEDVQRSPTCLDVRVCLLASALPPDRHVHRREEDLCLEYGRSTMLRPLCRVKQVDWGRSSPRCLTASNTVVVRLSVFVTANVMRNALLVY